MAKTLVSESRHNISGEFAGEATVPKLSVSKVYQTYALFNVSDRSPKKTQKRIATLLSKRPDVLAVEYLQYEKVFGLQANLTEMKAFKTKVKKTVAEYDPEAELEKERER